MQTRQRPLRDAVRGIDGARVRSFNEVLRNYIDHALAGFLQVTEAVLGVVETTGIANAEDGRVLRWLEARLLASEHIHG